MKVSILILLDYLFLSDRARYKPYRSCGFNPYFTGLSILIRLSKSWHNLLYMVSILILLDYLFLLYQRKVYRFISSGFQSLFYWIIYSYDDLIGPDTSPTGAFQSLFYWIIYSYIWNKSVKLTVSHSFNPYFTGLSILISLHMKYGKKKVSFNPYFTGLSILIFQ